MGGKSSKLALKPASHKVCRNYNQETPIVYDTNVSVRISINSKFYLYFIKL